MAEIKDMKIDELVDFLANMTYAERYGYAGYSNKSIVVKQEILSRFKEQQDRCDALTDDCAGLKRRIINLVKLATK